MDKIHLCKTTIEWNDLWHPVLSNDSWQSCSSKSKIWYCKITEDDICWLLKTFFTCHKYKDENVPRCQHQINEEEKGSYQSIILSRNSCESFKDKFRNIGRAVFVQCFSIDRHLTKKSIIVYHIFYTRLQLKNLSWFKMNFSFSEIIYVYVEDTKYNKDI